MNRLERAILDLHEIDAMAARRTFLAGLHPAGKTLAILLYMLTTVSFGKYDWCGVLRMAPGLIVLFMLSGLSPGRTARRMSGVLLFIALFGLFNPILDREIIGHIGRVPLTSGMVSMAAMFLKGTFCLGASCCLAASTGMEGICYGLQSLHVPRILVVVIMLIYRYLVLLLQEGNRIFTAYQLRAPGQNGVCYTAWGSLLGQLLLSGMSRAEQVYDSMRMRGFDGRFYMMGDGRDGWRPGRTVAFFLLTFCYLAVCRLFF
ncbi:MAG: energy-coupling factor transporter transmembrane protein EcfT [Clostridiales bacterium]|nr:energy-coupling factor transporter transmembrane protein EcfT [Clostridiales bacterium]